ncbi:hypothetical protein U3516DRAFT_863729 [Neocallimastix sp. 'constans']
MYFVPKCGASFSIESVCNNYVDKLGDKMWPSSYMVEIEFFFIKPRSVDKKGENLLCYELLLTKVTLLRVAGSNNITEPKWEAKYNASVSRSSNSLTFDPNSAKDTEYNDLLKKPTSRVLTISLALYLGVDDRLMQSLDRCNAIDVYAQFNNELLKEWLEEWN